MKSRTCPHCGKDLPAQYEGRYCLGCGTVFAIAGEPVSPPAPANPAAGGNKPAARRKINVPNLVAYLLIAAALVWVFAAVYEVLLK